MANDYSKITLKGDNEPLKGVLDDAIDMFKDWGERIKYTLEDLVGGRTFDELWANIKAGVEAFEASQDAINKLGYAIKASGDKAGFTTDKMKAMNAELRKVVRDSSDVITEAQRALLKYTNVRQRAEGNIFQETIKGASDLSAAVGGDLVSNVELLGAALQSPKDAFEALANVGVTFTRQQKALITQLQNTGQGVKAQQIILKELTDTYGGAGEKAANTFGAKMAKLNEYYDQAWKRIGEYLVPYLNKFIEAIEKINRVLDYYQDKIVKWFEGMASSMGKSFGSGTDWLKKFGDFCVKVFSATQAAIQEWQSFLIGGFLKVLEVASGVFKKLSTVVTAWVERLSPIWEALVKGAVAAWEGIKEASKPVFDYLGKLGTYLVEQFKTAFERIVEAWSFTLKAMGGMTRVAFSKLLGKDTVDFKFLIDAYGKGMKNIAMGAGKGKGPEMPEMPGPKGADIWTKVSSSLKDFFTRFKEGSKDLWDGLDKDVKTFLNRYGTNVAANSKTFDDFYAHIKRIMDGEQYKDVTGEASDSFKNPSGDKAGGGLEDLIALNRRITGATARSPELTELQKQTGLQQQIANNTKPPPAQPASSGVGGIPGMHGIGMAGAAGMSTGMGIF